MPLIKRTFFRRTVDTETMDGGHYLPPPKPKCALGKYKIWVDPPDKTVFHVGETLA
jgi:hypothetical protein